MAAVDLELRKQFQELQAQLLETRAKMRQIDAQMEVLRRNCQRSKLTQIEVKNFATDVNAYESIGRMFVKKPKSEIEAILEKSIEANNMRITKLEETKVYLENSLKERENSLREFIAQRQQQANTE
ncbi:prefoldin subunit 1-like protein [Leptotrombidium deliense]|uniref:Prefoldin subunit 1-like protein n=1 Tax=Leptotrombidium deliense TaxID=299467 RepID=A0A443S812_9ACAR|nr:prefoldin subunit 1-like protein [Leptotrombidium deliense]